MKETKFTPGPWVYKNRPHVDAGVYWFYGMDEKYIGMFSFAIGHQPDKKIWKAEGNANAALMATAPQMYELLVKFCDACNKYNIEALVPEYEAACTILNRINP